VKGVLFLVFGAVGLFVGITLARGALRFRKWPTVSGRIVEREAQARPELAGHRMAQYEARVRYEYVVGGRKYVGTRLRAGTELESREAAQRDLAKIPDEVTVHYNPQNPAEAYLLGEPWIYALMALAVGGVTSLLGLAMLLAK
jgi:hypothetical protein